MTGASTWMQRYLINTDFWRGDGTGSIFFYVGNEGDVELYANHTGLMWENAAQFGALLLFGEHRYYGQSLPPGAADGDVSYLSSSQALADYATLLRHVRETFNTGDAPAIAFGGSYGGVLAALFRARWPGAVAGAIASSAPLRSFPGQVPLFDSGAYYAVISDNLGPKGGSPPACAENIQSLWPALFADGQTTAGRARLSAAFSTCSPITSLDEAKALAFYVRGAFDGLSMANYPYPSDYISFPATLPAFPVRVACESLAVSLSGDDLYKGVAAAIATLYNASGTTTCNDVPANPNSHPSAPYDGIWDYQQCTEMQPDSQWFSTYGPPRDVFWEEPRNLTYLEERCRMVWNVTPALDWITTQYSLPSFEGASRIILASGTYDPWSGPGIRDSPAPDRDVIALNVTNGAHHLDLFFSHPMDPPELTAVRLQQMAFVSKWIAEDRKMRRKIEL
jgi:lysosomal Pro-X carboxypeptidase